MLLKEDDMIYLISVSSDLDHMSRESLRLALGDKNDESEICSSLG